MLERLATNQWFTARMSSASLISSAYPKLNTEQQEEHLMFFAKLCQDETPMVRRVAAKYLGKMLEHVVAAQGRESLAEGAVVPNVILPLYEELASSDQPVGLCLCFNAILERLVANAHLAVFFSSLECLGFCAAANYRKLCFIRSCHE